MVCLQPAPRPIGQFSAFWATIGHSHFSGTGLRRNPVGSEIAILEGMMSTSARRQNEKETLRHGSLTDQYGRRRGDHMISAAVKTEIDRWENEGGRILTPAAAEMPSSVPNEQ
jgi:hypothetical protein